MKQIILIFAVLLLIGCKKGDNHIIREETHIYLPGDIQYDKYGYYAEIVRYYNYPYYETKMTSWNPENNTSHCVSFFTNEFNDTVRILFVDFSNYPRREE